MARTDDGRHQCAAPGCAVEIADYRLACWPHWNALPIPLRHAINRAWNRRRRHPEDPDLSQRHLELVQDAWALWAGATVVAKA